MKKVIIIQQLFIIFTGLSQVKMDKQQLAVFELELSQRKNVEALKREVGDSLLVDINIIPYEAGFTELKSIANRSRQLTTKEVEEIFGKDPDKVYKVTHSTLQWTYDDFPDRLITFYKRDKEVKNRRMLSVFNVLSISVPVVRKDKQYALIQISNEHEGGVLRIYKNTRKRWVHYKDVQLYYI